MAGCPSSLSSSWRRRLAAGLSSTALATGALIAVATPAEALTFNVNTTVDAVDAAPGNGLCRTARGRCSLRTAIQEGNARPGRDITRVPRGTYRLTLLGKGESAGATGDLNITDSVGIEGARFTKTFIDGGVCADINDPGCTSESVTVTSDRVMSIVNNGTNPIANISGLMVQNGGGFFVSGGGIRIDSGASLSLSRCRVLENKSRQFGGSISNGGFLRSSNRRSSATPCP